MIYVGIDIAKQEHFVSAVNVHGEVLIQPLGFTNNPKSFSLLLSKLKNFGKGNLIISLESTPHYGENLISHLYDRAYCITVINPIQTASLRNTNIRKTKTDKVDTF